MISGKRAGWWSWFIEVWNLLSYWSDLQLHRRVNWKYVINCMLQSPSWAANSHSAGNPQSFKVSEGSSLCSQHLAPSPYPEQQDFVLSAIFMWSLTLQVFRPVLLRVRSKCSVHLILLELTVLIISGERYELRSPHYSSNMEGSCAYIE